ncbi:unnamed protein product [Anisakis simplex]|uniref:E1_dh domain-containing protein n=1 Tax=Anisakis simplex TaxID=6269 RepID=A0A0M3JD15_ANISI|nr:unnamed protein product [Anisakis simplex]
MLTVFRINLVLLVYSMQPIDIDVGFKEGCAVGIKSVLDENDRVIASFRCHGWTFLSGPGVKPVLCELTGRANGNVHGKGGSMHMYGKNFYGGNGIVGAQQSMGTGIAFALKYRKQKNVCFTLFGDGAGNQGQLFECIFCLV